MIFYILYTLFITTLLLSLIVLFIKIVIPLFKHNDTVNILPSFFFILLFLGFIFTFFNVQSISKNENRSLAKWSSFKYNEILEAPQKIDTYVNDHFGLRNEFIGIYRYIQFYIFNKSVSKEVVLGSDEWFFSRDVIFQDFLKPSLTIDDLKSSGLIKKLNALNTYLKEREIKLVIIVNPSKAYIYPEFLPKWIDTEKYGRTTINNFVKLINEDTNIPIIDLYNELIDIKSKEQNILYFKTDTHWNGVGAYYAANSISSFLRKQKIEILENDFNRVKEQKDIFIGDLSRSLGIQKYDNCNSYLIKTPKLVKNEISNNTLKTLGIKVNSSPWKRITVHNNEYHNPKKTDIPLIIADSYILSSRYTNNIPFNKYYSMHFEYISKGLNPLLENQKEINVVILSFVDRLFNNNHVPFDDFTESILKWDLEANNKTNIKWK
jgi:alginate O-acetyltransferase complex protein AlgJ